MIKTVGIYNTQTGDVVNITMINTQHGWLPGEGFSVIDDENAEIGDTVVDGELVKAEPEIPPLNKSSSLNTYYQQRLSGGFIFNGTMIETTDKSLVMINGAVTRALLNNNANLLYEYFPTDAPSFMMPNSTFIEVGLAIANHTQKCLKAEEVVNNALAVYSTEQQIKDAFDVAYTQA